ncbi:hypothetical protein F66182_746 [Fusarium sp. NRRL 66182]|nr:hypothetical protein F66182_746 [Fusarium sp. NRRL 66182]
MAMRKFLTSVLLMAAAVTAAPAGKYTEGDRSRSEICIVTTITLTAASTYTATIPAATPFTPTGTATYPGTPVPKPGHPKGHKNSSSSLPGISYAPYRADHQCKTKEQIKDDLSQLSGSYSLLRIYGTDCDQVPNVYSCAKNSGMKLFLGIWDLEDVQAEAQRIIDGIDGDWEIVSTVSVGNELVNNGAASLAKVLSAVKQARKILRAAGYQGPVVTVDTFIAADANPELCTESDYCAVNAHAFFDGTSSAEDAGKWLSNTVKSLKSKLPSDKRVVICETGWPSKGNPNGLAIPGLSEQKVAIAAIKEAFADHLDDIILFSAFNDPWKKEESATFNAEPYWGINGATSSSD